jgi:hypothetical protein
MTQEEALTILKLGHNVFLTGPAGSGKTHVLSQFISLLGERGINVAVTASTGIAATHLGGMTIHSWSGIGVKDDIAPEDLERIEAKRALWERFNQTKTLIIDEISMLAGHQLDMIDVVARHMRRTDAPFGGMQVVFSGDFFQLPPISRTESAPFAFSSRAWGASAPVVSYLESQHRQSGENDALSRILGEIRSGEVTKEAKNLLYERLSAKPPTGLETAKLFTHNADVNTMNDDELRKLGGTEHVFHMWTKGARRAVEILQKNCPAPETLRLKVGARVMFVKNDPAGSYVNGTLGSVVSIKNNIPRVRLNTGAVISAEPVSWSLISEHGTSDAEIRQVPLRLAWAITVHKSQGMTLDAAEIDLSKTFTPGQGYVALSRVRSLDGLFLKGIHRRALDVDPTVLSADRVFRKQSAAARSRLEAIDKGTLERLFRSFVVRAGGSIEPKAKDDSSGKQGSAKQPKQRRVSTASLTHELLKKKYSLEAIARERKLKVETIISHIESLLQSSSDVAIEHLRPKGSRFEELVRAFQGSKEKTLTEAKRALERKGIQASYTELRLARLFV